MWRYIFSGFLIYSAFTARAQETPDLVILNEEPSIAFRYLQVNYNALRFAENLLNKPKTSLRSAAVALTYPPRNGCPCYVVSG